MNDDSLSDLVERLVEQIADRVADKVVQKLCGGGNSIVVDQSSSELGPRKHIAAIRSGALPGRQMGRRFVALRADVAGYIAKKEVHQKGEEEAHVDETDELASTLGFKRKQS